MSHPRSRHLTWGPEGLIPLALFFKSKTGLRPGEQELQIPEPLWGEAQELSVYRGRGT